MITAESPFRLSCTISRDAFIAVLRDNHANADLLAERDPGVYWDECRAWSIDPNFILAMAWHESNFCTAGTAVESFSFGNTRSPSMGAVPYDLIAGRSGSFPAWASFLDGCASTAARLASTVWPMGAPYGERDTIRSVFDHSSGQVWAPSSDANDPDSYLGSVVDSMNHWSDQDAEPIVQTRAETPLVYSDYLTTNFSHGRSGHVVRAICLHVTSGASAASAISWFKNPASEVSSHVVIDRDGTIFLTVREHDTAWCQGITAFPNRDIPIIDEWMRDGVNPNSECLGLEVAGYSSQQPSGQPPELVGYSPAQFDALAYLLPVLSARHNVPIAPDTVWGHCELDSVNRKNCPGLSAEEWQRVYSMGTPTEPEGPYATADEAYDAWTADNSTTVIWAGAYAGKAHWYGFDPQPVSRTANHRLLAYDGGYAQDASGWSMDEWEEAAWRSGQLTIWGKEPPPPAPGTPDPPVPPGPPLVGAAWPINPGDGATDVATDITLQWSSDAPTSDVEFDQSDGVRIFALQAHPSTAYGPLELAEATTYVWRVRGRDSGNVSEWTAASFGTAHPTPDPKPPGEEKPPKPPSNEPYPDVVTPTGAAQPAAVTWRNTSDQKIDLAVSRQWRGDCDGGTGPWPDTDQNLNPDFPGAETLQSPLELRKLVRRLSMHPPIVEASWRAGLWSRVPATYQVDGSQWEDDASQDYNDKFSSMPAHAQTWASQICTLGTAIQGAATLAAAFVALGFTAAEAETWASRYHALRVRVRDLNQLAHC